jgi:hypothetical protein
MPEDVAFMQSAEARTFGKTRKDGAALVMQAAAEGFVKEKQSAEFEPEVRVQLADERGEHARAAEAEEPKAAATAGGPTAAQAEANAKAEEAEKAKSEASEEDVSALKSAGAPLNAVEARIETAEGEGVVGTIEVVEVIYGQEAGGYVNECKSKAEDVAAKTIQNVGKNLLNDIAGEDDDLRTCRLKLLQVVEGDD